MTTTPESATAPAEKITFHVRRKLQWKGVWYVDGDTFEASEQESQASPLAAWIDHDWIEREGQGNEGDPAGKTNGRAPKLVWLEVLKPIGRHGERFKKGQRFSIKRSSSRVHVDRWIALGKMRELTPEEAAPPKLQTPSGESSQPRTSAVSGTGKAGRFVPDVPVGRIDRSPWNPRKDFTSAGAVAELAELAQSIREQGIIEPLIVRPASPVSPAGPHTAETVMYELVAGERRWRAAKQAGLETVPCIVRELDKLQAIRLQAVENLQRRDINALEECEGYELLMREGKYTVKDIVRETGKSEASVYARLKLRDCPPGIRKALAEGRIPATVAELVARIDDVEFAGAAMDAILFPEYGTVGDGERADVLSFRQAKAWIENRRAWFEREAEWKKRQKDSHVAKTAAKVLSAEESARELMAGGYVRNSQEYIKPTDKCYDDPGQRTYEVIAREAGRELPAPVLARDPGEGQPVVLLPRAVTMQVLADLVPNAEEQRHRRAAADAQRKIEIAEADKRREAHAADVKARAAAVLAEVRTRRLDGDDEEEILRFTVGSLMTNLVVDEDDFAAALRDFGVPVEKAEVKTVAAVEWRQEYLRGSDSQVLHAWLVWFAIRDTEFYDPMIHEDRLWSAEVLLGLRDDKPQTSAVADREGVES